MAKTRRGHRTQHTTHAQTRYTRVHVTISGRTPLSTVDYTEQKQETSLAAGVLAPAPTLVYRNSAPVSEVGHFEVIFFKTAETDKKKQ